MPPAPHTAAPLEPQAQLLPLALTVLPAEKILKRLVGMLL